MKDEYQNMLFCSKCGIVISDNRIWEIAKKLFYSVDGDYYKYEYSKDEYCCKSCERDSKIDDVINQNQSLNQLNNL
jgi:hypothetical protein